MTQGRRALVAAALAFAGASDAGAQGLTVAAEAGLGGLVRPGRWAPVRVVVANRGPEITGTLVVAWGDAEVTREVTIPSPAHQRIDLYVRTTEVEPTVRIRVIAGDAEIAAIEAPVQAVPASQATTLCVEGGDGLVPPMERCDARVTADALPADPRGYDAVDRVRWAGGALPRDAAAAGAFHRWQSLRELEESGESLGAPRPTRPLVPRGLPAQSRAAVGFGALVYMTALLAIASWAGRSRRTLPVFGAIGASIAIMSGAALALGRTATGGAVVVHHATVLQQVSGGSIVATRAVAEFPAFSRYSLGADLENAVLTYEGASDRNRHAFDTHGQAVLAGTFPLGAKRAFSVHGFVSLRPLEITSAGPALRIVNRSSIELRDCRLAEGFSPEEIGSLQPGQEVTAVQQSAWLAGPVITCVLPELPFTWSAGERFVDLRGLSRLVAYRPPSDAVLGAALGAAAP